MFPKAILFDVDGVLVDSERTFNYFWRKAAELSGYSMTYEQALELRSLDSELAKNLFFDWYGDAGAYSIIRNIRKSLMLEFNRQNSIQAKKGVIELLDALHSFPITVAVVSSSPLSRIKDYLSSAGIQLSHFDAILTTESVTRGKPYPDVYLYACDSLGFRTRECMAVEDSPNGIKAAHVSGCVTVMIPDLTPCTSNEEAYVDYKIDDIHQIINILGNFKSLQSNEL